MLRGNGYIRSSISYLGTAIVQYSPTTIAVATAIGISLCVPLPFLYCRTSSMGYAKLPDRAWTSVESLPNDESLVPDISIKQVWVHGSWMKALERETLLEVIGVQDILLGPMSNCSTIPWYEEGISNVRTTPSGFSASESDTLISFFHSPLLYWNCSVAAIESDDSIQKTISSRAHQISPANVTIRPLSVFARTLLSDNRLIAADALVVSLFYKPESRAGDLWDERLEALAQSEKSRWDVYPADGRGIESRFFKFQSLPISVQDEMLFLVAYGLIAYYTVFSVRNLKTLKSKVGLFIVIAIQECFSILSGFTVAAFLRIDVSNIPLEAYPFIVIVVGLENMFRLVKQVEKTPHQDQQGPRVATALGAVGYLSFISVAQNLLILWLLSGVVSPGLAAFCWFTAISLTIDFAFFLTFFVATLTVDLRNYGLQDSFEEVRQRYKDALSKEESIANVLTQHRPQDSERYPRHAALPYPYAKSTVITVSFMFILASHFLKGGITFQLARLFTLLFGRVEFKTAGDDWHGLGATLGQTRDSVGWLKSQEHETLREILQVAKPQSHDFLARVYDPLSIVLKFAQRNPSLAEMSTSPPIDIMTLMPFWLSAVLSCCVLALVLTLWYGTFADNAPEEAENRDLQSGTLSSIQYLPRGHSLDIFMLATSSKCVLASVGFDHEIRFWNLESRIISSQLIVPSSQQHILWPVAAIAIDDKAEWLAICSKRGEVSFWNTQLQCFGPSIPRIADVDIVSCFFAPSAHCNNGPQFATQLLLIGATGRLTDIEVETANVVSHQICDDRVRSSHINSRQRVPLRLITVSEDDKIYVSVKREDCWTSQAVHFLVPILGQPSRLRFTIIPDLRMVGLALNIDTCQLYLIDLLSGAAIYTFHPRPFRHRTLRAIHSPPQQCLSCGAVALLSFSIAYTEELDGSFTMLTLSAEHNPRFRTGLICLRAERDLRERRCIGFGGGTEKAYSMQHAGIWEATAANGVAGVRRKRQDPKKISKTLTQEGPLFRRRDKVLQRDPKVDEEAWEAWEAWTMTARGIVNVHALTTGLFANTVGPMCSVGRNAIAVGLAEIIALVRFGNQLRDDDDGNDVAMRRQTHTRLAGRSRLG